MRTCCVLAAAVLCLSGHPAEAQDAQPLYRVFLTDGTALASFGEWVQVDDRLVFSMPVTADPVTPDLHLVAIPLDRIDLARSARYADAVRAAQYARTHGEADFARLSNEIADALNRVALTSDPAARLAAAEGARRSLSEWSAAHHGYRAAEVREIVGVLDGVISGLRSTSGAADQPGRFDLALSATTVPEPEPLHEPPDAVEVVEQLVAASSAVSTAAERVSLLQSVLVMLDRAVGLLPEAFATRIRAVAGTGIAEELHLDGEYERLRVSILAEAARYAERADARRLEGLRQRLRTEDERLGGRRPNEAAAILAAIDAHLEASRRLRLARDQWLLRRDGLRAYQRAATSPIRTLSQASESLDDIRLQAGPPPQTLRQLARRLAAAARRLAAVTPPAELLAAHAIFRSACELAESAVRLRLDAVAAADAAIAAQASAAASGALMLLGRGRADLEAIQRAPSLDDLVPQP